LPLGFCYVSEKEKIGKKKIGKKKIERVRKETSKRKANLPTTRIEISLFPNSWKENR